MRSTSISAKNSVVNIVKNVLLARNCDDFPWTHTSVFYRIFRCSYIPPAHAVPHFTSYCSLTGGGCLFSCAVRIILTVVNWHIYN